MRANLDELFAINRQNENCYKLQSIKAKKHYLLILRLHSSPFLFPMFFLTDDALFKRSGGGGSISTLYRIPTQFVVKITNFAGLQFS